MRARNGGRIGTAVIAIAVGLVLAVAVPANAQSSASPPVQRIVTAVARTSHLTMKSGYSEYLFVGGSSAGAAITKTSFKHYGRVNCGAPESQGPVGPSTAADPQGSFASTGTVAVVAGVAISGYSVHEALFAGGGSFMCGPYPSRIPVEGGTNFGTGNVGGLVLIMIGTEGVGTLAPSLYAPTGLQCTPSSPFEDPATLTNVTVSKGTNDGGAVGIFSVSLPAESDCEFDLRGTSYNKPGTGNFGYFANAYLLIPRNK
jgi:hypothetical protein